MYRHCGNACACCVYVHHSVFFLLSFCRADYSDGYGGSTLGYVGPAGQGHVMYIR